MRLRQVIFYVILFVTMPIWLPILLLMFSWDIADNLRGAINAGYSKLLDKDGGMNDVV